MYKLIFVLPLGDADAQRVHYTIKSIRKYCTDYLISVVLDGVKNPSALPVGDDIEYLDAKYKSGGHWGAIWLNQMHAMCAYIDHPKTDDNTLFVKIDADALIVQEGFYQRAKALFNSRPKAGQIGQVYTDSVGNRLVNKGWQNFYHKTLGWRGYKKFILGKAANGQFSKNLSARLQAYQTYANLVKKNPAPHEYAIGGCYCLTQQFVADFYRKGLLDANPFLFTPEFGEDAIMGLYVGALGYTLLDDTMDQGLFAVGGMYNKYDDAFRANPLKIAQRGHTVIHPFKFGYQDNSIQLDEFELADKLLNQKQAQQHK
ncbi:hypothetical protein [Catenovulum sediminis]|uniref:Glycosyltransferase n=1 Tax=Catenovulum sediminis TaxID=1740262 RepID=A0ABV1RGE5_9ALTE